MKDIGKLYDRAWSDLRVATADGDAATVRRLGAVVDEMDRMYEQWSRQIGNGGSEQAPPNGAVLEPRQSGDSDDFTGRPIYGAEFCGKKVRLSSYKELLLNVIEECRTRHPDKFDSIAVRIRGRGPYFSENPRDLRSAHRLDGSRLYAETNLSAQIIVGICPKAPRCVREWWEWWFHFCVSTPRRSDKGIFVNGSSSDENMLRPRSGCAGASGCVLKGVVMCRAPSAAPATRWSRPRPSRTPRASSPRP